jgi:hypothetical protein
MTIQISEWQSVNEPNSRREIPSCNKIRRRFWQNEKESDPISFTENGILIS